MSDCLELTLEVTNHGAQPCRYEAALHTYLAVSDIRQATVTGLEETDYLDAVAEFARCRQGPESIRFTGETDRLYVDTGATCVVDDPGWRRRLIVEKTGSAATVVWNPWVDKARALADLGDDEWPGFVCIETCNVGPHAVSLAAEQTRVMTARIRTET